MRRGLRLCLKFALLALTPAAFAQTRTAQFVGSAA